MSQAHESPPNQASSLTTLPDEVQQIIYRHVYPITDITLLPDDHPDFIPKSLTQEFNMLGYYPIPLLLTSSKICGVAKPVRDSSFTGRVNVYRARDLAHSGHWLHHNLRTVRLLAHELPTPGLRINCALFTNLSTIEITDANECISLANPEDGGKLDHLFSDSRDMVFTADARKVFGSFFNQYRRESHSKSRPTQTGPTIHTRLRYVLHGWHVPGKKHILGVTVISHSSEDSIAAKAFRNENEFRYWEAEPELNEDASGPEGNDTDAEWKQAKQAKRAKRVMPIVKTLALKDIPARYAWVKHVDEKIRWEDME